MTLLDRAYGALAGSAIGNAAGIPATHLTRLQIRRAFGKFEGFAAPAGEASQEPAGLPDGSVTELVEETRLITELLIREEKVTSESFLQELKKWAEESDLPVLEIEDDALRSCLTSIQNGADPKAGAAAADTAGAAARVIPVGIKYNYDIPFCIEEAVDASELTHNSAPALAAACAVAAAVAAGVNGEREPEEIMKIAFDAAVYGERRGSGLCGPSVSRRIKLAQKLVDEAKGMKVSYKVQELADLIGTSDKAWEAVPFALGVFYAVKGNAAEGIKAVVNTGDCASVNASICGAICGAYSGINSIPAEWSAVVKEKSGIDFKDLAGTLLKRS